NQGAGIRCGGIAFNATRNAHRRCRQCTAYRGSVRGALSRRRLCRSRPAQQQGRTFRSAFKQNPTAHRGAPRVGDHFRSPPLVPCTGSCPDFLRYNMLKSVLRVAFCAAVLVSASAASAEVTVYTAGPAALIEKLAAGFTAESGIKVNFFQATTGKVMARIEAEAANPVVDVLISASWDTATDFAKRDWLLPYASPNADKVPDFLKTDTAVAQGVSALASAWNPSSGTPKPSEWSDLAKPEYKDLVNLPDPAQSGATFELVAALSSSQGWDLFDSLSANGAIVAGANAEALNPVLQGAK